MLLIVAAHAYYLVPTARFELAHLTALAPQASVSTNSTTSATVKKSLNLLDAGRYFGAAPFGAGCAGAEAGAAAGAGAASGVTGAGADVAEPVASEPVVAGMDVGAVSPGAGIVSAGVCAPGVAALALLAFSPTVSRIDFGGAATARVPT